MQSNFSHARGLFLLVTMAIFGLVELIFYATLHPYFKDAYYQSIQFILALAFIAACVRKSSTGASLLFLTVVGGYFVGFLSYIIKWGFLDGPFGSSRHLSDVGRAFFSFDPWLSSIFTYCWIALPLAVFFSQWVVRRMRLRVA